MQRWNGWGDEKITMDLPPQGLKILREVIGPGRTDPDYLLEMFIQRLPKSRLPRHPLVSFDPKLRLDHAHGQSLTTHGAKSAVRSRLAGRQSASALALAVHVVFSLLVIPIASTLL